jgi:hypothetical protein
MLTDTSKKQIDHMWGSLLVTCAVALSAPFARAAAPKDCAAFVLAPAPGAQLTAENPEAFEFKLEWRPVEGAQSYTVDVGKEADIGVGKREFSLKIPKGSSTNCSVHTLKPGHYYWRVSAGTFRGPVCEFTIVAAPFPATPSEVGAIPSGHPLIRTTTGFYCESEAYDGPPKPFGLFFVRSETLWGPAPVDTLVACVGDKLPKAFGHRFEGNLGLMNATSKTIHAGLVVLPNHARLLVAVVPTAEGTLLSCRTPTPSRYQGVPVAKSCEGAGVVVRVPDATKPDAIEIVFPDGRIDKLKLAELTLP